MSRAADLIEGVIEARLSPPRIPATERDVYDWLWEIFKMDVPKIEPQGDGETFHLVPGRRSDLAPQDIADRLRTRRRALSHMSVYPGHVTIQLR